MIRIGGQERGGQRRGRRLALRAGHPDRRRAAQPQEQVGLRDEGRRCGIARGPCLHERPERRPQAGLRRRVVRVDRGRRGHERGIRPRRRGVNLGTEREADVAALERIDRTGQLLRRAAVVHGHPRAGVGEEARQGDPAAGEPEHGHRAPAQRAGPDRVHRERIGIDRPLLGHRAHTSTLTEAKKKVSPSNAARIPTIQKRIVIFSSSQPPSSKW